MRCLRILILLSANLELVGNSLTGIKYFLCELSVYLNWKLLSVKTLVLLFGLNLIPNRGAAPYQISYVITAIHHIHIRIN